MKGKHFSIWTNPENLQLLQQWWEEGLSCDLIADKFRARGLVVTRNAVIGKVHRMDYRRKDGAEHQIKPKVQPPLRKIRKRAQIKIIYRSKECDKPVIGASVMTNPHPSKRVLFRNIKDGQCKAIIGYINGILADAVCCGEEAPLIIKNGRVVHSSWCSHHHEIYTIKGRYESRRRTA